MSSESIVRTVNRLLADGAASDADLLRLYVRTRDELAFAALVHRHGPMVFGVCRRTLAHVQDAEDAFQATFLVLAQRAHTVRPDSLGRWLYGVAVRVANKARVRRARRMAIEASHEPAIEPVAAPKPPNDWLPLLDAAMAKLSDRDRGPLILCDLQGRSRAEAASELGIPEGTLSSRLARSREKLRARLARLGAALSLPIMTSGLAEQATATLPASLIESTVAAGTTAAAARELADGVIRTMLFAKATKLIAACVCVMGTLTVGLVWMPTAGADPVPKGKEAVKPPAVKDPANPDSDIARIQGTWVIELTRKAGDPKEGAMFGGGAPGDRWDGLPITFVGEHVNFGGFPGRTQRFRLHPTADPKRIDFTFRDLGTGPRGKAIHRPSIYRFEGDKLRIVLGDEDLEARPDSFEISGNDSPFVSMLLRRPTDEERKALEGSERAILEGTWWAVVMTIRGEIRALEAANATKLVVKGDRLRLDTPDGPLHATFDLNLASAPWQIDLTLTADLPDMKKGTRIAGIISRLGAGANEARLMLALGNGSRPASFDAAAKDGTVYTFIREGVSPAAFSDVLPPKPPKAAPLANKRLRELQEQRVKALEEQFQGQFERVKIGKDPLTTLLDNVWELAQAEIEIAANHEARVAAMEKALRTLAVVQEQLENLRDAGLQTREAASQARASRLKAEIELEKLKSTK
jgi:RNA polymerase sigma factor (sigma-70 family)